jgi:single-strand DNA-binding protein
MAQAKLRNLCLFTGNSGKDPELQYLPSGDAFTSFGLAVHNNYQKDGEWVEETTWVDLSAFGPIAERLVQKVQKGTFLQVQTTYTKRTVETEEGNRTYHNFKVNDFVIGRGGAETDEEYEGGGGGEVSTEDIDIPF